MFAAEVALFLPSSLIWSPSNTRGQLDHEVYFPGGRVLSLECKGVVSNALREPAHPWMAPIDYPQLAAYLRGPVLIHYVLPAKPDRPRRPWERPCTDVDQNGWCLSCSNVGPAARRRWAGKDPLVKSAPIHLRFQPWFAHWCWLIPANALQAHLRANGSPRSLSCADDDLKAVSKADRLCHFLAKLATGELDLETISVPSDTLPELLADWPAPADIATADERTETTALQLLYVPVP